jgi:phosphopantothenoylcysteine decarboxylase/phosphopantothenate--cysteine ligase
MKKNKILKNKKILIGVSAGAAIYKIYSLVRLFKKNEAEVKLIMTENATKLASPLLFQSLIGSPVYTSMFQPISQEKIEHVKLAQWADIFIIAPATANTIGKLANGIADNLLTTVFLAFPEKAPVIVVPAMESNMWENVFLQENIKKLKKRKNLKILPPKEGLLASGKVGKGRMAEPEEIFRVVKKFL